MYDRNCLRSGFDSGGVGDSVCGVESKEFEGGGEEKGILLRLSVFDK